MKSWLQVLVLVGISVAFAAPVESRSEEGTDGKEADGELTKTKEALEQAVDWYEILPEREAKDPLPPRVVLRWQNAVRTHTGAALMVIWTDHGRPDAMASIYRMADDIYHEIGSISRSNKLVARDRNGVVWSPARPGVEFRDLPDAPEPADTPAARLRQMKSIAGRFTARLIPRDGSSEILRLLPRQLYRYDLKALKGTDPPLEDGAVFAFAMGTDPEVVLLLELVKSDGRTAWQYAFARATTGTVDASLGDEVVWSVPAAFGPNPTAQQTMLHRPMP